MNKTLNEIIKILIATSITITCYSQISYQPLYTTTSFDNAIINTLLPVGSLAGSADVANGAASYVIPIELPAGTNGVVPTLSINYNSQGSRGNMGMGWALSGLSGISRGLKTLYYDNVVSPVNLTSDDRFLIDGMRLIATQGNYGATGTTYSKETTDFSRITSYNNIGTGPQWFKCETKEGIIMEYGNTTDSRYLNVDNTEVLYWGLSKMVWPDGNFIDFVYESVGREHRIKEINYTGNTNASLLPYNKIKFVYAQSAFTRKTYEAGQPVTSSHLLEKIEITAENNTSFKSYIFRYGHDNINEFLVEVIEEGSDGSQFNSSKFEYGAYASNQMTSGPGVSASALSDIITGDFDGDGFTDMVVADKQIVQDDYVYYTNFFVYRLNPLTSNFDYTYYNSLNKFGTLARSGSLFNFFSSDYTGDGGDDLVFSFATSDDYNLFMDEVVIFNMGNNLTSATQTTIPKPSSTYDQAEFGHKYFTNGDYNGDGMADMILILSDNLNTATPDYKAYIYYGGISTAFTEFTLSGAAVYHPIDNWGTKDVRTLDFDGDGKSELMICKGTSSEIFTFSGYTCQSLLGSGYPTEYHLMYFGDFNGDKKTDMLTRAALDNNYAPWSIAYSTGEGWNEQPFTWQHSNSIPDIDDNYQGDIVHIADLNGDNRQDIFKGRTYLNSTYQVYYSKGDDLHFTFAPWTDGEDAFIVGAGDFNGDGRSDFAYRNDMSSNTVFSKVFHPNGQDHLLKRMKNGYGHITTWEYRLLTEPTLTYGRTQGSTHPIYTVQVPQYVVYSFKKQDMLPTRYEYRDMKLHKGGRGVLGFRKITRYAPATDLYEDQEFEIAPTSYLMMPKIIRHRYNSTNLQIKTFTNEVQQLNTGMYERILYHRVSSTLDNNIMEGRMTTQSHTVDANGNILTSVTNIAGIQTVIDSMTYGTYGSFIPNKVEQNKRITTRTGEAPYTVTTKAAYNSIGQLTGSFSHYGLPKSVYTQYFYNNRGNQDSTIVSATGIETRTSSSIYDPKGRYIMSSRNTLGQTSTVSEYDLRWTKPKVVTGIDGLTTSYQYDAFGRLTHTTMPQGYTIQHTYEWINTYPLLYRISTSTPGAPDTRTWYDRSGRPLQTLTYGLNGENIYTQTTYDAHGRIATSTAPYKTGDVLLTTTYTYDNYSRPESVSNTLTTTQMAYSYSGGHLTTTTTKVIPNTGNQVSSTITDATGKLMSSTDYGGTLLYQYYSHGQPKSVSLGSQVLTSHTYDAYARKTSTTDINAGVVSYDTDALGQLISETNPLGYTTTIQYDKLGRITTRTGPEGVTSHAYFASGTGASVNQLKKITSFGGDIEDHTYDAFGRLQTHTHTIAGTAYTTSYGYNQYNQLISVLYPGGFSLDYLRNARGYLQEISDQTTTFYTAGSANAYLQSTQHTLGSGFQINKTYHHSIPTSFVAGNNAFVMNYTWDYASGNLQSRQIHGVTESFMYDNLNRLTHAINTTQTIQANFASNGNIMGKTDAGPDYTYDSQRIHAMSGITTPAYPNNINLSAQNISYTSFQQPAYITEGNYRLDYVYGSDYQRIKSVLKQNGTEQESIIYLSNYERKIKGGNTMDIYYIHAGDELIAIAVKTNGGSPVYYYTYTDYLGSIQHITNSNGSQTISGTQQNYDAWGRRRTTAFGYAGLVVPPDWLIRGYTGHEQLWQFNLINMNGRIYDPVLARMHSPDNEVSMPGSTQGYNRYSYAHNNPLKYTDPDGNVPILAPIMIGAAVGILTNGINNAIHHRNFFDGAGKAATFGAIGGLVSAGIGTVAQVVAGVGSPLDAAIVQVNLHGLSGGLISFAQGGNPVSGFVSGATSSVVGTFTTHLGGGATATIFGGGLTGGIGAAITGGNFWQGMQQGLITTGLNHWLHPLSDLGGGPGDPPFFKKPSSVSQPFEFKYPEFEGLGLGLVGFLNEGGQKLLNNSDGWFDFRQGKIYSHGFHGNQYTGLRSKSLKFGSIMDKFGKILGGYNQIILFKNWGNIGHRNFLIETGVNFTSTFGGLYGGAVGLGWEIGRYITSTSWYQNWKYQTWIPYRAKTWGY